MIVIGIDPGTERSAIVGFDGQNVLKPGIFPNDQILLSLTDQFGPLREAVPSPAVLVIEKIESYGMAVGETTFETVFWSGRFAQAWFPRRFERMGRRVIKLHLCHSNRATDSNIRQALIDRFGPGTEKAIGRKNLPGPLYWVKGHAMAALAVAVTWFDLNSGKPEEVRPGVRAEF